MTPTGSLNMGSGQGISLSSGAVTTTNLSVGDVPGYDGRINLTGRGTQLANYGTPVIRRINFTYSDFSAAATTFFVDYEIDDFTPRANDDSWVILDVFGRKIDEFVGGSVTAVELTFGPTFDADDYIAAGRVDLFNSTDPLFGLNNLDRGDAIKTFGLQFSGADKSTNKLRVTLTSSGGDLDTLVAGEASIYVRYYSIPSD